jgi:hypothetical protein
MKNAYKILVERSERNRTIWRPQIRLEDNIKIHLKETAYEGLYFIHLAQDRVQCMTVLSTAMNLWIQQNELRLAPQEGLCCMELVTYLTPNYINIYKSLHIIHAGNVPLVSFIK